MTFIKVLLFLALLTLINRFCRQRDLDKISKLRGIVETLDVENKFINEYNSKHLDDV